MIPALHLNFPCLIGCQPEKPYFFAMKSAIGLLLALLFISCNDSPPRETSPRPRLITKDSNSVKPERVNPYVGVDVSPMDMSYLPVDYPKFSNKPSQPVARVIYSRPHKQGRNIFGNLIKYGQPWRLGANEATEIEFFQPVTIQGRRINKGRYVLYCIPQQDNWTIIFNNDLNSWGLNIDRSKDLFRFEVPVIVRNLSVEYFSIVFQENNNSADLIIGWDDLEARLPIQYAKN